MRKGRWPEYLSRVERTGGPPECCNDKRTQTWEVMGGKKREINEKDIKAGGCRERDFQ